MSKDILDSGTTDLVAATTTETGLRIRVQFHTELYPTGVKITDAEMTAFPLTRHQWNGGRNYTLAATPKD